MKIHQLVTQQRINKPIDEVWDFFSDAGNLAVITPEYMNFRVTSEGLPDVIYPGMIITYKVSPLLHIPLTWVTEITHVKHGEFFVDEQRVGPYSLWHHEHHFVPDGNGVMMTDKLHYKLPLGFLGEAAHSLFIKKQLNGIFEYRRDKIEKLFNGA